MATYPENLIDWPVKGRSGSGRWSHWDEIGWVHYPEIGWSHSNEIRWVQSREILQRETEPPPDYQTPTRIDQKKCEFRIQETKMTLACTRESPLRPDSPDYLLSLPASGNIGFK